MISRQLDEEAIFHIARRIADRQARADYLEQVCGDNTALLTRVRALLEVHEQEQDFLRSAGPEPTATLDAEPITEVPGMDIGRYRLMEQIGEGGMGVVFVAEQRQPLRRKVALKVIKPGMDSKAVVARFEAERQALALMDHPNIAHVLDAGSTTAGRPYFVMEYVRGVPITEYCDQNRLTIRERLELFIQVCQAIQHAHQKGIVHRDIKPSNVLVTLHDGKPVPKVIDFGVAKALNTRLTDRTIYTAHMQVIGTLMYMSPEQAEMSGLDVDTRADVYGLGVLLYELLTGTTPFQKEELDQAGFDEQRRIIREKEPQRASLRISSLGETATTIAEQRKTDARKLHQQIHGDLDWIVMRALEKDRTRRYETAIGFAADVQRFLSDEPIEARPPSSVYRLKKLASRHRVALATTAFVLLTMFVATALSIYQWRAAVAEAARADEQARLAQGLLNELKNEFLDKAILLAVGLEESAAAQYVQKAIEAGAADSWEPFVYGLASYYKGDTARASNHFKKAVEMDTDNLSVRAMQSLASLFSGDSSEYCRHITDLRDRKPRDEYRIYDQLFTAYATLYEKPAETARITQNILDEASHLGLARVIRAEALGHLALDTGDYRYIEEARQELRRAETTIGDNPFALVTSFFIHILALRLREPGEERDDIQRRAESLVKRLEDCDYPISRGTLAVYYELIAEDHVKARREWQSCEDFDLHRNHIAAALLYHNELDDARSLTSVALDADGPMTQVARAYLFTTVPDGRDRAISEIEKLIGAGNSVAVRGSVVPVYLLLGKLEEAKTLATELLQRSDWLSTTTRPVQFTMTEPLLKFVINGDTVNLLSASNGSLTRLCDARFIVAMRHLCAGERDEAIAEFARCCSTNQINRDSFYWARAFHKKLLEDENWPYFVGDKPDRSTEDH